MHKTKTIIARVTPEKKARFAAACARFRPEFKWRSMSESEVVERLTDDFIKYIEAEDKNCEAES
jgi:hypothetical protein